LYVVISAFMNNHGSKRQKGGLETQTQKVACHLYRFRNVPRETEKSSPLPVIFTKLKNASILFKIMSTFLQILKFIQLG